MKPASHYCISGRFDQFAGSAREHAEQIGKNAPCTCAKEALLQQYERSGMDGLRPPRYGHRRIPE